MKINLSIKKLRHRFGNNQVPGPVEVFALMEQSTGRFFSASYLQRETAVSVRDKLVVHEYSDVGLTVNFNCKDIDSTVVLEAPRTRKEFLERGRDHNL